MLAFATIVLIFALATVRDDFGRERLWDTVRGIMSGLLIFVLAFHALKDAEARQFQLHLVLPCILLGSVYLYSLYFLDLCGQRETNASGVQAELLTRIMPRHGDPNGAGMVSAFAAALAMAAFITASTRLAYFFRLTVFVAAAGCAVGSGSRGATVGLAAAALVGLLLAGAKVQTFLTRFLIPSMVCACALLLLAQRTELSCFERLQAAAANAADSNYDGLTTHRITIQGLYWDRLLASNGIGTGFDYSALIKELGTAPVAHNTWLQVISDFGLIGFLSLLAIAYPSLRVLGHSVLQSAVTTRSLIKPDAFWASVALGTVVVFVTTLSLTSIFEMVFWWPLGVSPALLYWSDARTAFNA
jgi:O-antigen ligase